MPKQKKPATVPTSSGTEPTGSPIVAVPLMKRRAPTRGVAKTQRARKPGPTLDDLHVFGDYLEHRAHNPALNVQAFLTGNKLQYGRRAFDKGHRALARYFGGELLSRTGRVAVETDFGRAVSEIAKIVHLLRLMVDLETSVDQTADIGRESRRKVINELQAAYGKLHADYLDRKHSAGRWRDQEEYDDQSGPVAANEGPSGILDLMNE